MLSRELTSPFGSVPIAILNAFVDLLILKILHNVFAIQDTMEQPVLVPVQEVHLHRVANMALVCRMEHASVMSRGQGGPAMYVQKAEWVQNARLQI